ncbi:MAG: asparaginase [Spirochaetales bacterium]|nr:asparaginase [Spirochaetales bacterium]
MKRVLIIDTGGTISQVMREIGTLVPGEADIVTLVPRLKEIADIDYVLIDRVDSTDMTQNIRVKIVEEIEKNHNDYHGFVITHGTDTMADTACALNYMVQNLGKPIVLTGAQLPIFAPGPDGLNNLYYSVKTATEDIGEVVICFGDRILRGNRSNKYNVEGFNAFDSPREPYIGNLGVNIRLNENRIKRFKISNPIFFKTMCSGIVVHYQVSGGCCDTLKYYIDNPEIKGVIIVGFGTGNVQSYLLNSIEKLTQSGKKVVIVTACSKGSTKLGQYQTGLRVKNAGALEAKDLTIQATIQKMMYALGRDPENFQDLFYQPIGRDMD